MNPILDTELTRVDITQCTAPLNTQIGFRPYWNGKAFEMRDPRKPDEIPDLTPSNSVLMKKAGVYPVVVPAGYKLAAVSGSGGGGGGGAGGSKLTSVQGTEVVTTTLLQRDGNYTPLEFLRNVPSAFVLKSTTSENDKTFVFKPSKPEIGQCQIRGDGGMFSLAYGNELRVVNDPSRQSGSDSYGRFYSGTGFYVVCRPGYYGSVTLIDGVDTPKVVAADPYNGASGGGGGSSGVRRGATVLFESGGGGGANGGRQGEAGGAGGRGALVAGELIEVVPGETLEVVVGDGGMPGNSWLYPSPLKNKGGAGGAGLTPGQPGEAGTLLTYSRAAGSGGGKYAGKSLGQRLAAYNGDDGDLVGDFGALTPSAPGAGGKPDVGDATGTGSKGSPGFIQIAWMEMPKSGRFMHCVYTALNEQVVEVYYDCVAKAFMYKLPGAEGFSRYTGVPTPYGVLQLGKPWLTAGTKLKIESIEHVANTEYVAVATPSLEGRAGGVTVLKTDGIRIIVIGYDSFYQDRYRWIVDFPLSNFNIVKA